jgi:cysteine desulfurase/selenocysteine lyase
MYNTLDEVDALATALEKIVAGARGKVAMVSLPTTRAEYAYAAPAAPTPDAAADELAEVFDVMDDWTDRYQYLIELGTKLPPMPPELKTDATRVRRCQSTVHMFARKKPGSDDVLEFLADSDADIVRGELALLQRVYSGQRAQAVLDFDMTAFMHRLGLDKNLSMGRRTGLSEMTQRILNFATELAGGRKETTT